jgi:hypothetical protein
MRNREEEAYEEWRNRNENPKVETRVVYEQPKLEVGEYAVHIPVDDLDGAKKQKVNQDGYTQFCVKLDGSEIYVRWFDETKGQWSEWRTFVAPEPQEPEQLEIEIPLDISGEISKLIQPLMDEIATLKTDMKKMSAKKTAKEENVDKTKQISVFESVEVQ